MHKYIWIWMGLAVGILLSLLFVAGVFSNIQLKLSDSLYGGKQALDSIVIVAIDDPSLQELGRWPWPRSYFAGVIDALNQSKTIGVDVAFFESSAEDATLAKALRESGKVVIPVEYTSFSVEQGHVLGKKILLPAAGLKETANLGYVNIVTDRDGVTRAVNLDIQGSYDNFAIAVYKLFWKSSFDPKLSLYFKQPRFLVNFVDPPGSFKYFSFADVLKGRVPADTFKGKLVLVGSTSPDMHDDYFVPTSAGKAMPGVEIHANTLQTLITQRFLRPVPNLILIIVLMLLSVGMAWVTHRWQLWALLPGFAFVVIHILGAIILFEHHGIIWNLIYPPLVIVGSFVPMLAYHYVFERKEKRKAMGAFSKYVSPVLVQEIMKHPERLKLGGERREITVFFSDIRGFTTISEKLSPEELVKLLNQYLSAMTQIVLSNRGLVDKYIGDAIMAFWGAPLDEPDHAKLACWTALQMRDELARLRVKWVKQGYPEVNIGVGLNTGDAVIGNMGSAERFDYTAMGDTVNLASRLESLTKQYGVMILITESTKKATEKEFVTRQVDLVAVKGKKTGVAIYELVGKQGEVDEKTLQMLDHFADGMKAYFDQKWKEAMKEFERANKVKHDKTSEIFIERCKTFEKTPPSKDWDGVWVMTTK